MKSQAAKELERLWFKHPVVVEGEEIRAAMGVRYGNAKEYLASVNTQAMMVTNQNGEEVICSAVLHWSVDHPVPKVGGKITLPEEFGLKPNREIVTAKRVFSGNDMTPDHIEVTLK